MYKYLEEDWYEIPLESLQKIVIRQQKRLDCSRKFLIENIPSLRQKLELSAFGVFCVKEHYENSIKKRQRRFILLWLGY
ncbi:hypothetical protein V7128_24265 [Neobacillus vireti]|uniref:hypothetical protein n=1 Tax=Neobacillus vireti TaxID=220686 RepID=UPI0030009AEA